MNTPSPCDKCVHCKWNCLLEDDPNDSAYCNFSYSGQQEYKWGDEKCPLFCSDELSPEETEQYTSKVLSDNQEQVKKYNGLRKKWMGFFMGAVLKKNKQFSPTVTQAILENKLKQL